MQVEELEEWHQEQHEEQEEQGLSPHAAAAGCRSSIFEKAIEPNGHRH